MLAHDRHDVAELNRMAREWRERWGFIVRPADRRPAEPSGRSAIGWCAAQRLRPRRAQRHPRDGRRPRPPRASTSTCSPITARRCASRPTTSPTPATATPSPGTSPRESRSIAPSSWRAPSAAGAEWAYVAGSRQRHDLQVFVTHHEAENVEEALARAWSRSQAKSLALDLVDPADAGGGDGCRARRSRRGDARAAVRPGRGAARGARGRARGRGGRAQPRARACGRAAGGARCGPSAGCGRPRPDGHDSPSVSIASRRGGGGSGPRLRAGLDERGRGRGAPSGRRAGGARGAGAAWARVRRQRARAGAGADRGAVLDRSPARFLEGGARSGASPIGRRPSP